MSDAGTRNLERIADLKQKLVEARKDLLEVCNLGYTYMLNHVSLSDQESIKNSEDMAKIEDLVDKYK